MTGTPNLMYSGTARYILSFTDLKMLQEQFRNPPVQKHTCISKQNETEFSIISILYMYIKYFYCERNIKKMHVVKRFTSHRGFIVIELHFITKIV